MSDTEPPPGPPRPGPPRPGPPGPDPGGEDDPPGQGGPPGRAAGAAPAGAGSAGGSSAGTGGGGGRRWAVDIGLEIRELRTEVRRLREGTGATATLVRSVAGDVSEILPRLDTVEVRLAELAAGHPGDHDEDDPGEDHEEQVGLTPAMRWATMTRDQADVAWDCLRRFVGEVLNEGYVLTRDELPDCWPVHPRAVRELAWLRTSFHAANHPEAGPHGPAEWHTRWLPAALRNLAAAIDPRECAPGKHRLTEAEREDWDEDARRARAEGQLPPPLSPETGPDRPRYHPDRFPALRGPAARRRTPYGSAGPVSLDAETPVPPSTPPDWLPWFEEARAADLLRRETRDDAQIVDDAELDDDAPDDGAGHGGGPVGSGPG